MDNKTRKWLGALLAVFVFTAIFTREIVTNQLSNNSTIAELTEQIRQYENKIAVLEGRVNQYQPLKYILYADGNHLIKDGVLQFDAFSVVYIVQSNQNQDGEYNVYGIEQGTLRMQDMRSGDMLEFDATQGETVHIYPSLEPNKVTYYTCGTKSENCTSQIKTARVLP